MYRASVLFSLVMALVLVLTTTALAAPAEVFPKIIPLPIGFRPEGIAIGNGTRGGAGPVDVGAEEGGRALGTGTQHTAGDGCLGAGGTDREQEQEEDR